MARSLPSALDSASKYQTLFNQTNGLWSGAEKVIPLGLADGTHLWISGLCWSGPLATGGGSRSGNTHNNYSSFLVQGNATLKAITSPINDISNNRYFTLNSFPVTGTKFSRLDPVSALVKDNFLYITCYYSTTDYTDWTLPIGPMYLLVIDVTINTYPIVKAIQLPVSTIGGGLSIYFGSFLMNLSDNYLYVGGQQNIPSTTNYSHYIARIPWIYINDSTKWQYYSSGKWSTTYSVTLSSLITIGAPEISIWRQNGAFYILAKQDATTTAINLYTSNLVTQGYKLVGQVATETARPAGGWSNGAYIVKHARLASGKRLGFYSNGIANDTYDNANPLYKRPTFFEF